MSARRRIGGYGPSGWDESLAILEGLWRGEPFSYQGRYFQVGEMTFVPPPVQRPRIPIWVIGAWPGERSMRRTVRYDGVIIEPHGASLSPDLVRDVNGWVRDHRASDRPFDIIVSGETDATDPTARERVAALADAGATWWLESPWQEPNAVDDVRRRVRQGPPARRIPSDWRTVREPGGSLIVLMAPIGRR